jgi:hypothetical protein
LFSGGGASLFGNVQVGTNNGIVTVDKPPFLYDPSMTIFYDFDNASVVGNTLKNLATGVFNGTLSPSLTTMSSGQIFGTACLSTNAGSQLNQNILISPFITGSSFSISLWIKKSGNPGFTESIFDFADLTGEGSYSNTIALAVNTSGNLLPILTNTTATGTNVLSATNINVTNNLWTHIVWRVASSVSTIYINGELINTQAFSGTIKSESRIYNYIANTNSTTGTQDFGGNMDNFRFYSGKTLSYSEIYQLYTSQTYNLDVSGGILANGRSAIFEEVGTVYNNQKGTLTLLHGDAGGGSSIVFPSVNNGTSDYAYMDKPHQSLDY